MKITISDQPTKNRRTVLLAPCLSAVPKTFARATVDAGGHDQLLQQMQKLRGSVYLDDGAITSNELTQDRRHKLAVDDRSWHMLTLDNDERVIGCSRFSPYRREVSYRELGVARSALANNSQWGRILQLAVDAQVALARKLQVSFAEVGGWALAREHRCTNEALRIALGTYSLAASLGEAVCLSTVTVRHCSSSILKRLGGAPLDLAGAFLPAYHDPQYNCEMEILRFDSRYPADRFKQWISGIQQQMTEVPVICAAAADSENSLPRQRAVRGFSFQSVMAASAA
jgi:hypothetical protein